MVRRLLASRRYNTDVIGPKVALLQVQPFKSAHCTGRVEEASRMRGVPRAGSSRIIFVTAADTTSLR
jgi:hypothetical protein